MAIQAGQTVTAGMLNRLQPVSYHAVQSALLNLTTTTQDVPGCSITLTTVAPGAVFLATGFFDYDLSAATTGGAVGWLDVDGTLQSKVARFSGEVATDLGTPGQQWRGTLAAAGNHTLKLRANGPASGMVLFAHTTLTVVIYEVV